MLRWASPNRVKQCRQVSHTYDAVHDQTYISVPQTNLAFSTLQSEKLSVILAHFESFSFNRFNFPAKQLTFVSTLGLDFALCNGTFFCFL